MLLFIRRHKNETSRVNISGSLESTTVILQCRVTTTPDMRYSLFLKQVPVRRHTDGDECEWCIEVERDDEEAGEET